ncbi:molybdenum cofactor biosynthesis protein MoaE [Paenibacillus sp. 481]|uniref:molybdenum cofactor biosynthesis protein MoaE n=1 Tax=Paenibacillus sp. 481 TaxID=2835869 RepID=UPI0022B53B33|nr:molybdenum cofactor biosynthesis protein MoaE [Paenibacillus sp. 481]UHA72583.1 molybdenum cofactor biosynthesis protein MoaE [Paenibacillus sp. 481]
MSYSYTIQCFAGIADAVGQPSMIIHADSAQMTVRELKALIAEHYPAASAIITRSFMAVNQAYAPDHANVAAQDELALIPPVSGGDGIGDDASDGANNASHHNISADGRFELTYAPISTEEVANKVADPDHGAALIFIGTTREHTDGKRTVQLDYEAYVPMALGMLVSIGEEIAERWPGTITAITHRLGTVQVGAASVVIAVSAPRRVSSYEASRYAIERLKQRVPIWKKESWDDGSEWIGHQLGPWDPLAEHPLP